MVIQTSKVNPLALPSLPVTGKKHLPQRPAVYFMLSGDNILYIGQTSNLFQRFVNHEMWKQLGDINSVRVAWLECDSLDDLSQIESELISRFRPNLNFNFSTMDKISCVTDGILNVEPEVIKVESSQWWQWLNTVQSFRYCPRSSHAPFTARKEKHQYWYGYRKVNGKLRKRYIGKSEDLTIAHLDNIARLLDTPTEPSSQPVTQKPVTQEKLSVTQQAKYPTHDDIAQLWEALGGLRQEVAALGKLKAR